MLQREDGSWLVDGDVGIERLKSVLDIGRPARGKMNGASTLGGFIMHALGRIPAATDHFDAADGASKSWTWTRTGSTRCCCLRFHRTPGNSPNARESTLREFQRIDLDVPTQLGRCLEAFDGLRHWAGRPGAGRDGDSTSNWPRSRLARRAMRIGTGS